jgi:hypothetical protein
VQDFFKDAMKGLEFSKVEAHSKQFAPDGQHPKADGWDLKVRANQQHETLTRMCSHRPNTIEAELL